MDFRTEISVNPSSFKIGLKDSILTIGSCFAESVGRKFSDYKFQTLVNPFGTTYHPLSIHRLLHYSIFQEFPREHSYLVNEDVCLNYDFHSSLRSLTTADLKRQITEAIAGCHFFIKQCKVLVITYGTAWLYERCDNGEAVANCHKMPGSMFRRRLASTEEIVHSFREILGDLQTINPGIKVVLTVSPVRHTKDTFPLNNVSKSVLRIACHQLATEIPCIEYFPAFEIMMDDLRDYRYYSEDMIHPNSVALDYIWNIFKKTYFEKNTLHLLAQWDEIRERLGHHAFNPNTKKHMQFLNITIQKLRELNIHLPVTEEILELESNLNKLKNHQT